jgi:hypothetical protein
MTTPAILFTIPERQTYRPTLTARERRAYAAAHKIAVADLVFPEFPCPGRRQTLRVDEIARIILEEMA